MIGVSVVCMTADALHQTCIIPLAANHRLWYLIVFPCEIARRAVLPRRAAKVQAETRKSANATEHTAAALASLELHSQQHLRLIKKLVSFIIHPIPSSITSKPHHLHQTTFTDKTTKSTLQKCLAKVTSSAATRLTCTTQVRFAPKKCSMMVTNKQLSRHLRRVQGAL